MRLAYARIGKRGLLVLAMIVVGSAACASIMGVEEAELANPAADSSNNNNGDAGKNDGSPTPGTDAGCLGPACSCTVAGDCQDKRFSKCDGTNKTCVACLADNDCTSTHYCLPTHECAPGCKNDKECSDFSSTNPFCNTARHQCVACRFETGNGDCQKISAELFCAPSGVCTKKCVGADAGPCTANQKCCGNLCINTSTDVFNCGACGDAGACTGGATSCCASKCIDPLTNNDNCGGCGLKCSTAQGDPHCGAGACAWTCNEGFSHCAEGNTGCETSTSADTARCGSCTNDCAVSVTHATAISCVSSKCAYSTCSAGFADCDNNKANGCECAK